MKLLPRVLYGLFLVVVAAMVYLRPTFAPDTLFYAGAVAARSHADPKQIHDVAYGGLERWMGHDAIYAPGSPYWNDVRDNPYHFAEQLPWYSVKALYVEALYRMGQAGIDVYRAARLLSAVSVMLLGIGLFLWLRSGVFAAALLLVGDAVLNTCRLGTPDALSSAVVLLALYLLLHKRMAAGSLLLLLAIFLRPDTVVVAVLVFAWLWWEGRMGRVEAGVLVALAVGSEVALSHWSGFYGWAKLLFNTHQAIGAPAEAVVHMDVRTYLSFLALGLRSVFTSTQTAIWLLLGLLAFRRLPARDAIRGLLAVTVLAFVARLLLFPFPQERQFLWMYLVCGVALVTSLERSETTAAGLVVQAAKPDGARVALAIPTYNEAGNIATVLERAEKALGAVAHEIVVVDDSSSDGTADRVREVARSNPTVRLVVREDERGLASAVVSGWQSSSAPILGVMDADLQHPPELLPELLQHIDGGADLALASRYVANSSMGEWSVFRRILSVLGIWTTAMALPAMRRVSDPASGFFLVRREAIAGIPLRAQGFKLLLEILVRGRMTRVDEVPFEFGVRQAGSSKGDLRVVFDQLALLWTLRKQ